MAVRSYLFQSGLLVALALLTLPSLLASKALGSGPLARDALPLTLTLLEVIWIPLLLPFTLPPRRGGRGEAARLVSLSAGLLLLALPILIFVGRQGGVSTAYLLGTQLLIFVVTAFVIIIIRTAKGACAPGPLFLSGALLVGFVPPFVERVAEDLLGRTPGGIAAAISPISALAHAYPDRVPWSALGVMGIGAGIAALGGLGLRRAGPAVAGVLLFGAILIGGRSGEIPPADPPTLETVRVSSPLGGIFRPGGWTRGEVLLRNRGASPLGGELIIRVGGIRYPRAVQIPPGKMATVGFLFFLAEDRPSFRALFRREGVEVALPELEEALLHLFRPLEEGKALIGWAGDAPGPARKIVEGISAAQVSLPDSLAGTWQALDAVDLVVVTGRIGGRLTGMVREWQLHGGALLSLSQESSVDLGAPLPEEGEGIAVRRRGRGLIGTMDLEGARDRGALFQEARRVLHPGGRSTRLPPASVGRLFGTPRHEAGARHAGAGWIIALAALGVGTSAFTGRRVRLGVQVALAAGALATIPWVATSGFVVDEVRILSGSSGSSALSRTSLLRVAAVGYGGTARLPGDNGSLALPAGPIEGLTLSAAGEWSFPLVRGAERIFLRPGEELLPGVIEISRGKGGEVRVRNGTPLSLDDGVIVQGDGATPLGTTESLPLRDAIREYLHLVPEPFLEGGPLELTGFVARSGSPVPTILMIRERD